MATTKQQKRPVVKTTGIKIGLTLAAVGASIGGWATLGLQQRNSTAIAAQISTVTQAAPAATTSDSAPAVAGAASNTTSDTSAATQSSASTRSTTSIQPMARTRSSR